MKATPIEINWNPDLPIFAREEFLKAVSDEYGWLGGFDNTGQLRCILPYTIVKKGFLRLARFRVETIWTGEEYGLNEERLFLKSVVEYLRFRKADLIIPPTTNCIFRTYPTGAVAAPYGTYIIDLSLPEETLWKNIERITRQNIKRAVKIGITIEKEERHLEPIYNLIKNTFKRSRLPFMDFPSFVKYFNGLGEYGLILKAMLEGSMHSCVLFAFSNYCAYAVYAGNAPNLAPGANKLLYWEAIRYFKSLGIKKYDFVGARINPKKGSKQESLYIFKKHFGGKLIQGFIWKYPINIFKYHLYNMAARLRSGGDLVDAEKHKLGDYQIETENLSEKG
jgi:hypothetical protein